MKKYLFALSIILALAGIAIYQNYATANKSVSVTNKSGVRAGDKAAEYDLNGYHNSNVVYHVGGEREKPLLINFWASWCGPCKEEAPDLMALYREFGEQIDFYAINASKYDPDKDSIADFVADYSFELPVLMDPAGDITDGYKVISFPTSFLIDRHGNIQDVIYGVISNADWQKKLAKLLKPI